ncbi:lipoprotein [Bombella intestini]|uniref:Lipoprotein n=1 Tax=Bombella intestini TaxID=1539051 RepID=A0A1S8GNR3_9PROT|nr:outer membrane protein assembly factor BamE [Bombella intestini]OOL17683.1 lipoprotein [Bombella intestini]
MRKILFAGAVASVFVLAGCTSSGNTSIKNETSTTVDQKIQDGITTKDQVRTMYGDPLSINFTDSGHEVWKYLFSKSRANGTNFIPYYSAFSSGTHGQAKTLLIIYDDHGRVWHHSFTASDMSAHSGVSN